MIPTLTRLSEGILTAPAYAASSLVAGRPVLRRERRLRQPAPAQPVERARVEEALTANQVNRGEEDALAGADRDAVRLRTAPGRFAQRDTRRQRTTGAFVDLGDARQERVERLPLGADLADPAGGRRRLGRTERAQ